MHLTGAVINLPACIMMLLITAILVVGITESARFNAAMVAVKVGIVALVILFGLPHVHDGQSASLHSAQHGRAGDISALRASWRRRATVFFAYVGFETVSVAAQETRNPERDVSISILAALAVCTLLYVLMSVVLIGHHGLPSAGCARSGFLRPGARSRRCNWLVFPVNIAAIAGPDLGGVRLHVWPEPRLLRHGARRLPAAGLRPGASRFRTPHLCTIIVGVVGAAIAAIFPLDILADLVSIGTLLAFISVCVGIMILRITAPKRARKFRTPYVWFVAPAGIVVCGVMMVSLSQRHLGSAGGMDRDWAFSFTSATASGMQRPRNGPSLTKAER